MTTTAGRESHTFNYVRRTSGIPSVGSESTCSLKGNQKEQENLCPKIWNLGKSWDLIFLTWDSLDFSHDSWESEVRFQQTEEG